MFSVFNAPITNLQPRPNPASLPQIYAFIRNPRFAGFNTGTLRSLTDEAARRAYKGRNFFYCTFSGIFSSRADDCLVEHSGLICLDFDHLPDLDYAWSCLKSDPNFETQLLFRSPSGDGLKWVVPIDIRRASNEEWYIAISNYVQQTYGLTADPSCKNVSRPCFLPYDPQCYIEPRLLADVMEFDPEGRTADLIRAVSGTNIQQRAVKQRSGL